VHVAVDEQFLHLTPAGPLRGLGARPMSIPWEEIRPRSSAMPRRWLNVEIRGQRLAGPAWCLELASPPAAASEEEEEAEAD
jgi:hypothetical protein